MSLFSSGRVAKNALGCWAVWGLEIYVGIRYLYECIAVASQSRTTQDRARECKTAQDTAGEWRVHTAKTKCRKFETNIPRKGISGPQSQFPHSSSVSDLYIPTIGLPILLEELCGPILGLYKSLTDT